MLDVNKFINWENISIWRPFYWQWPVEERDWHHFKTTCISLDSGFGLDLAPVIGANVLQHAGRAGGIARHARVAAMQDQIMVRVGDLRRGKQGSQLVFRLQWGFCLCEAEAIAYPEYVGIDR